MGLREEKTKESLNAAQEALEQSFKKYIPQPILEEEEVVELDVIEQLKANILMLGELQSRLRFMNDELHNVIGTKK